MSELRDPDRYWKKLTSLPTLEADVPAKAEKALASALPEKKLKYRLVHRVAGLGSLGRQRFAALAEWKGGLVAREAKALVPSAGVWASRQKDGQSQSEELLRRAIRCPDPFLELRRRWVLRRLAPDCSRVELKMLPQGRDEYKLLEAMGRETANVHLGSTHAIAKVKQDLKEKPKGWLHKAVKIMVQATTTDWREWCVQNSTRKVE